MASQSPPSVDDLIRHCELSEEEVNKEITSDRFHEIGPYLLKWKVLAPILNLTQPEVEAIEKDIHGEELKRIEFLLAWKQKQCLHATYKALAVALCKIERREDARNVFDVLKGICSSVIPTSPNPPVILSDQPSAQVVSLPSISFDPPFPSTEVLPSFISKSFNLESEIQRLKTIFKNIVQSLENYLLERKVSVTKLQEDIKNIPLSLRFQLGNYYRDQTSRIFKTESVRELVECLSWLWDYLNPGLLDYFVKKFGSNDNIKSMNGYLKELKEFRMSVKLSDYLRVIPRPNNVCNNLFSMKILTEMEENWEKQTLQDMEEFKIGFSEKTYIQTFLLHTQPIQSSIAIVFSLPYWIQINFSKLEPFFRRKGVIKVSLNDCCLIDWTKEPELSASSHEKNHHDNEDIPHTSNHEIAKAKFLKEVISKEDSEWSVIKQDQSEIDESISNKLLLLPGVIQTETKEQCSDSEQSAIKPGKRESISNKLSVQPGVIQLEAKDDSEQSAVKSAVKSDADESKLLVQPIVTQHEAKEHYSDSEQSSIKLEDDKSIDSKLYGQPQLEAKEHWADSEQLQSAIKQNQSKADNSKVSKVLMQSGPKDDSEQSAVKSDADESKLLVQPIVTQYEAKEHYSYSEQSSIKLEDDKSIDSKLYGQPQLEAKEHWADSEQLQSAIKQNQSKADNSKVSKVLMQSGPKARKLFSGSDQNVIKQDQSEADEFKGHSLLEDKVDSEQSEIKPDQSEAEDNMILIQPGPEAREHYSNSDIKSEGDEFEGHTQLEAKEHFDDNEQTTIKPNNDESEISKLLMQPGPEAKEHFSESEKKAIKPDQSETEQLEAKEDQSEAEGNMLLTQPVPEARERYSDGHIKNDKNGGDKSSKLLMQPGAKTKEHFFDSEQTAINPNADESKGNAQLMQPEDREHFSESEQSAIKPDQSESDESKGNTLLMQPGPEARENISDSDNKSEGDKFEISNLLLLQPEPKVKEHFSDCEQNAIKPDQSETDESKGSAQLMLSEVKEREQSSIKPNKSETDGREAKKYSSDSQHSAIKPDRSAVDKSKLLVQPEPEHFSGSERSAIKPDQSDADNCEQLVQSVVIQPTAKEHCADSQQSAIKPDKSESDTPQVCKLLVQPGPEAQELFSESDQSAIKPDQSESEENESTMQSNLIVDLQSFDFFLEKRLTDKLLTQSEIQSIEKIMAQGIVNLHSHYKGKYEDILITILNQNFQKGIHTVEGLNSMHKLYSKERVKFEELKNKNSPPLLQAYLINLVIEISPQNQITQILQQVTHMMEDFYPQIEECFLVEINKVLHSDFSLEKSLQSFKQYLTSISVNQSSLDPSTQLMKPSELVTKSSRTEMKDPFEIDRKKAQSLFKKLGLEKHYPTGLKIKNALCVKSETLELSLIKLNLTDPKKLVNLILHKLMSYDGSCRSDLMPKIRNNRDDEDEDEDEDEDTIHPVDSLLALILCSDNFLRQDLYSRLAKCQFSVPFILPDPFSQKLILPLWAMRSIVKNWKTTTSQGIQEYSKPIISYGMPIISFLRFGEHQSRGASKSKMLNRVISESNHDYFFHHDCPGGQSPLLLGKGLVDMTWYLPFAKHSDSFHDVITFLNLHGDAKDYPRQNMFLSQISSMCFILLSEENLKFDEPTIEILRKYSECAGGVTILNDTKNSATQLRSELPIEMRIIKLDKKNAANITTSMQNRIRSFIKDVNTKNFETIEDCCSKAIRCDILIDEDNDSYKKGLELASEVKSIVIQHKDKTPSAKEVMLPLHGEFWKSWADKDKELYRQVYRGRKSVNEYTAEINAVKKKLRDQQLKHAQSLTPVMKSFVGSLLKLGGPTSRCTRNYFLQCLKLELNDLSINSISVLQQQYQRTREELSVLKEKTNVREGRVAASEKQNKMIKKYKGNMEVLQKDIVNASFGLEHLLRELGQMYEAFATQSSVFRKDISRLPRAAAELLIDGYPLELMDGDTAHVPLKWVTAVLTEVVKSLNDPKVYVLSVLGLQSSGKSTMLNTTFGLQFNVGSGRCTRGAFMQLLPLDKKLRRKSNFSYILVVDTEGLRAPELDSISTQKHDNELATFVIGLANTTLINIYGEVPGDIDDILQTSVHAFLRMNKVNYRKSCQFVHQNTGSSINTALGSEKFTEKLNKFTVDAAREEGCEGEYETFNDVIKFDNVRDVHHFPGLWKGGPPMAPVSTDYSSSAQNLKYHLIKILKNEVKDKGLKRETPTLSSFQTKLSDLWDAVLKEKFVFSFKNTLEITAYNSLETMYTQWDWKFREEMLKWEQQAENLITTADPNTVSQLVKESTVELEILVSDLFIKLQTEMRSFFEEDKHSEILEQWRGRFETKLKSLSGEMREHAKHQILKLGEGRAVFSKIDKEKKEFTRLITESVKDLIRDMKQEQEELNGSLEIRKLESSQLKKILDQDLFGSEDLEKYRSLKYITGEEVDRIKQEIQQHSPMTGECLNNILFGDILSIDQVEKILKQGQCSESELKTKFDVDWKKVVNKLPYRVEDSTGDMHDIANQVERSLLHFVRGFEGQLLGELSSKNIKKWRTDLCLEVVEETHFRSVGGKVGKVNLIRQVYNYFNGIVTDPHGIVVQKMTDEILYQASLDLQAFKEEETDFNPAFTQKILRTMDQSISTHSQEYKKMFSLTQKYRFDIYLTACARAIPVFEEIARSFQRRNDPLEYLKLEVKKPLFTKFKDQYYQTRGEEAIANNICAHLERPVKSQIEKSVGSKLVGQMKNSEQYFNSKMALKVKILTDLHKKNDFELYMVYISNVKRSIKEWLRHYTIEYCGEEVNGENTRLQIFAKEEVSRLIQVVKTTCSISESSEDASEWLKAFCTDVKLRKELGALLDVNEIMEVGVNSMDTLDIENIKVQIKNSLEALEVKLHDSFNFISCEEEMKDWKDKPHVLLKTLVGCTEQCPFCGEQCDLIDPDHSVSHRAMNHSAGCLKGYQNVKTEMLVTEFCPSKVSSNGKFQNEDTNQVYHPYKDYQEIYPNWSIPPDVSAGDSLYWMHFVSKFKDDLATHYKSKPPDVPKEWEEIEWPEVEENLKKIYNL